MNYSGSLMATLNRIAMTKELLNVKMHSIKDCQEVIDEIDNEVLAGEVRYRFAGQKEKFLKDLNEKLEQFDSISNALKIGERQTSFHLVQKGTRFGIFSGYGISVIQPIEFLQIIPIHLEGNNEFVFIAMNENFKWGILEKKRFGNKETEILPFIFEDINAPTEDIYPVKYYGKWGLYYSRGKEFVIEPQYEDASIIREGLWAVKKEGQWGFVDLFNNIQVPFEFEQVSNFSHGYAHAVLFSFMEDDGEMLINHQGKIVHFKNPQLYDDKYWHGLEVKKSYVNHEEYSYLVNDYGDIVIPKDKYRYLGRFSEGLLAASIDGEKLGFIDIEENIVIPFEYRAERWTDSWDNIFHHGFVTARLDDGKYSKECILINHNNEKVFPHTFRCESLRFSNGHFENRKIGDRFKRNSISLIDLINYQKGKDMSYLIRTDAEVEKELQRRRYAVQEPYEWTEEDTWDTMTDGMYGDYPGGDVDYEDLGF